MGSQAAPVSDRVVVGIDGSPASREALEWAVRHASTTGSMLEIVGVWNWPIGVSLAPIAPGIEPELSAEHLLKAVVQQKRAEHPNLRIEGEIVQGDAAAV